MSVLVVFNCVALFSFSCVSICLPQKKGILESESEKAVTERATELPIRGLPPPTNTIKSPASPESPYADESREMEHSVLCCAELHYY
eukprot:gene5750-4111_t